MIIITHNPKLFTLIQKLPAMSKNNFFDILKITQKKINEINNFW
jgi:hypothetical protein